MRPLPQFPPRSCCEYILVVLLDDFGCMRAGRPASCWIRGGRRAKRRAFLATLQGGTFYFQARQWHGSSPVASTLTVFASSSSPSSSPTPSPSSSPSPSPSSSPSSSSSSRRLDALFPP
ncbi:uncharacterized protein LOC134782083 [Penaeus indicus]|uniref:uncharacterized protein LOC134782083 n=1 Tax=Penaeus indicus TaxID=29960 RepID=UPI00300D65E6